VELAVLVVQIKRYNMEFLINYYDIIVVGITGAVYVCSMYCNNFTGLTK